MNKLEESLDLNYGSQSRKTETTTSESQTINTAESVNNNSDQVYTHAKARNEVSREVSQMSNEDNDCIFVRHDKSSFQNKSHSHRHQNVKGNNSKQHTRQQSRAHSPTSRNQNAAFVNDPSRVMTKNLARHKYNANHQKKTVSKEKQINNSMSESESE